MEEPQKLLQFPRSDFPLPQYEFGQFYTLLWAADGRQTIRIHNADGSTAAVVGELTANQVDQYLRRLHEAGLERAGENSAS